MIISSIKNILKSLSDKGRFFNSYDYMTRHFAETMMKSQRKKFLELHIAKKSKEVISAVLRPPESTVIGLRKQSKCPGVILQGGGKPEVDLVFEGKYLRNMMKRPKFSLEPVWIRYEGQQVKCLPEVFKTYSNEFIIKAIFKRIIPGEPVKIKVPINLSDFYRNPYLQEKGDVMFKIRDVSLICYNDDWPTYFNIDISFVNPNRPYRLADLANTFPPGLILDPSLNPMSKIAVIKDGPKMDILHIQEAMQARVESTKVKGKTPPGGATGAGTTAAKPAGATDTKTQGGDKKK